MIPIEPEIAVENHSVVQEIVVRHTRKRDLIWMCVVTRAGRSYPNLVAANITTHE